MGHYPLTSKEKPKSPIKANLNHFIESVVLNKSCLLRLQPLAIMASMFLQKRKVNHR